MERTRHAPDQTIHRSRSQYGGIKSKEAKRLKELEVENATHKRLGAGLELDISILREAKAHLGTPR